MNQQKSEDFTWYRFDNDPEVQAIGYIHTKNRHPNRNLPFWVFIAVSQGSRTVYFDRTDYLVNVGQYLLLPPNTYHGGIDFDEHAAYYVHFSMSYCKTMKPQKMTIENISLPVFGQIPQTLDEFAFLESLYTDNLSYNMHFSYSNCQFKSILQRYSIHNQTNRNDLGHINLTGKALMEFLYINYNKELSQQVFEREFNLSYRQLNNIFQKSFHTTIKQKTIELRVDRAYFLVINGIPFKRVATEVGFSDYYYFLKCFKKVKGITPTDLKRMHFKQ